MLRTGTFAQAEPTVRDAQFASDRFANRFVPFRGTD